VEIRRPDPTNDFEEVLALVQACDRAVYGTSDWTADELREEWDGIDLEADAWLAVEDDRIAGVMHIHGVRDSRVLLDGYVHPELTGRGAGTVLLDAAERRALEIGAGAGAEPPIVAETAHLVGDPAAPELLAGRGYVMVRTYHRMVIDLDDPIPASVWPDGIELRPFDLERDGPALHTAIEEAFSEEWSHEPRDYATWVERVFGVPQFDPGLVLVAWDGDEIAAASINF